jgi:hypothetical protein
MVINRYISEYPKIVTRRIKIIFAVQIPFFRSYGVVFCKYQSGIPYNPLLDTEIEGGRDGES